ncbi:MAG: ComEA family DNA-binding protein [Myxococcota bacterium]|nr:ComEA family DNA-binding protein [Myxococcota bacterium]
MRATPVHLAIGLLVGGLIIATMGLRFADSLFFRVPPTVTKANTFCVGIDHPQRGLGIVCTRSTATVLGDAIRFLGLPVDCNTQHLPLDLKIGDKISFHSKGGVCRIDAVQPLPGQLRLLCGARLNVNLDSACDLMALPGIGEKKARAIVASREKSGPFQNAADLTRVPGIGPVTAQRLKAWLVF